MKWSAAAASSRKLLYTTWNRALELARCVRKQFLHSIFSFLHTSAIRDQRRSLVKRNSKKLFLLQYFLAAVTISWSDLNIYSQFDLNKTLSWERTFHWHQVKRATENITQHVTCLSAQGDIIFFSHLSFFGTLLSWFVNKNMKHEAGVIQHSITRCSSREWKVQKRRRCLRAVVCLYTTPS